MCSYDLDKFLLSSYTAIHKLFPHVEEKDKILPCALLVSFQLMGNGKVIEKESEESPSSLCIGYFETLKDEMISPESELVALRKAITQVYKDPPTGWLIIKEAYEKYIKGKGELDESNNT